MMCTFSQDNTQHLLDLVCEFCTAMGMTVSVPKLKVQPFNVAFPGLLQWTCDGEQLEFWLLNLSTWASLRCNAWHGSHIS